MDTNNGVLIGVLGAVAVLAIIGLVLMFNSAHAAGMAFAGSGQFGVYANPGAGSEQYFEREWEPSYLDRIEQAKAAAAETERR